MLFIYNKVLEIVRKVTSFDHTDLISGRKLSLHISFFNVFDKPKGEAKQALIILRREKVAAKKPTFSIRRKEKQSILLF